MTRETLIHAAITFVVVIAAVATYNKVVKPMIEK